MPSYGHFDTFYHAPERSKGWRTVLFVWITWGIYFAWLWPRTWFQDGGGIFAGTRAVAEQWPAHSSLASVFAYREPADWMLGNPQAAGEPFGGGFVSDALAGFLIRLGLDHGWALMLTALAFTFLFLAMLALFYRAALDRTDPTWVAVTLFLCAGGLGFTHYATGVVQPLLGLDPSWIGFRDNLLQVPPSSYTVMPQHGLMVGNPVTTLLIVHRDLLLGMALALGLLALLLEWYRNGFEHVGPFKLASMGIGLGLLAVVHGASLAVAAVVVLMMALTSPGAWRQWFLIGALAVAVGLPLLQFLHGDLKNLWGPLAWRPGGLTEVVLADQRPWWMYWWENRGLFLPVAVISILINRWWGHPVALAGVVVFAAVSLVQLRPELEDNAIFFAWAQVLLVIPVAHLLAELRRAIPLGAIPAFLLVVVLIASGALDLWRTAGTRAELTRVWGPIELELAERLRDLSRPTDQVFVALTTRTWPAELTGRPSTSLVEPMARLPSAAELQQRMANTSDPWLVTETSAMSGGMISRGEVAASSGRQSVVRLSAGQ